MEIKDIEAKYYSKVAEIYLEGIATGQATFETTAPTWENWDKAHLQTCRIAAFEDGQMLGWAALSPVSGRCVYAGVAEVSVYVSHNFRGKGIGKILLTELIKASEADGIWTLQSGTFRENIASIELHEKCGFRQIGYREKVGCMNGIWRDTILLERRSVSVGV